VQALVYIIFFWRRFVDEYKNSGALPARDLDGPAALYFVYDRPIQYINDQ